METSGDSQVQRYGKQSYDAESDKRSRRAGHWLVGVGASKKSARLRKQASENACSANKGQSVSERYKRVIAAKSANASTTRRCGR